MDMVRTLTLGLVFLILAPIAAAQAVVLETGGFSFSDEKGGFRLISASGAGTRDDPVVLFQELTDIAPAVLVIRRLVQEDKSHPAFVYTIPSLHLVVSVHITNKTGHVWVGFDLELQEKLNVPSTYFDGLSFDQPDRLPTDVGSDTFVRIDRRYEPYDRIQFTEGSVDPNHTMRFDAFLTDVTPVAEFYLVQEPKLITASLDRKIRFAGLTSPQHAPFAGQPAGAADPVRSR